MRIHRERYGPSYPLADHEISAFVRYLKEATIVSGILFHVCAPGSVDDRLLSTTSSIPLANRIPIWFLPPASSTIHTSPIVDLSGFNSHAVAAPVMVCNRPRGDHNNACPLLFTHLTLVHAYHQRARHLPLPSHRLHSSRRGS